MSQQQKMLEERTRELETIRRQLAALEREKFPPDALTLLAQKRELHAQLEREEMEKHELLAQINALVGEMAQLRANANETEGAEELSTELEQLKLDFAKKEAELQRTKAAGEEAQRRQRIDRLERERLEEELRERDELLRELTETSDELGRTLNETSNELKKLKEELMEEKEKCRKGQEARKDNEQRSRTEKEAQEKELEKRKNELETAKEELEEEKKEWRAKEKAVGTIGEEKQKALEAERVRVLELGKRLAEMETLLEEREKRAEEERAQADERRRRMDEALAAESERAIKLAKRVEELEKKEAKAEEDGARELDAEIERLENDKARLAAELLAEGRRAERSERELETFKQSLEAKEAAAAEERTRELNFRPQQQQPTPPMANPRKSQDRDEDDELARLGAELDKHRRLVTVLRKKLQQKELKEKRGDGENEK